MVENSKSRHEITVRTFENLLSDLFWLCLAGFVQSVNQLIGRGVVHLLNRIVNKSKLRSVWLHLKVFIATLLIISTLPMPFLNQA